jgi:hypothetical protein
LLLLSSSPFPTPDAFSWLLIVPLPPTLCWSQAAAAAAKLDAARVLMLPPPLPPRSHHRCHAVANALPRPCHRCQCAANATAKMPAITVLPPPPLPCCHHRQAAAAATATALLPPLLPRFRLRRCHAAAKLPPPPLSSLFLSSSLLLSLSPFPTSGAFSWLLIVPPPPPLRWRQAAAVTAKLDAKGVLAPPLPLPPRSCHCCYAVTNALPQHCHCCQHAADATITLLAVTALPPPPPLRCCHPQAAAAATAAALLPPPPPRFCLHCHCAAAKLPLFAAVAFVLIVFAVIVIIAISDVVVSNTLSRLLIVLPPLTPCWCQAANATTKLDAPGVLTPPLPLPPRSRCHRHAVTNALPWCCHRCWHAANATVKLPTAAMLLLRCRRCTAAAAPLK